MTTGATMYRLPGCRLFASGVYRGKPWPSPVVLKVAQNAAALGPQGSRLLVPPGVGKPPAPEGGVGHDENEADLGWLERTDLPAAGWVDPATVRAVPDPEHPGETILTGDLVNVPQETADKVRSGEYAYGSAELYDDFLDDFGTSHGPALRRYVILGGEVPQVKRLGRLPMPVPMAAPVAFAETRPPPGRVSYLSFAERAVPTRADLIKSVQAVMPGVSQATLEVLTDDQLKELVANLPQPQPAPTPPTAPTGTAGMDRASMTAEMVAAGHDQATLDAMSDADLQAAYAAWKATQAAPVAGGAVADPNAVATMGDPAAMTREELTAELVAAGQDATALESMSDDDLRNLYTSLGLGATADTPVVDPAAAPIAAMSDRTRRRPMTMTQVNAFAEREVRKLQRQAYQGRVMRVNQFCDRLVREGRILPAQKDDYRALLMFMDDDAPVHKFSDGSRIVQGSMLERKMAALAQRSPVIRFGEKVHAGGDAAQTTQEAAVRRAEQHADTIPEDAWRQTSFGSKRGFVTKFSESAKKDGADAALKTFGIK